MAVDAVTQFLEDGSGHYVRPVGVLGTQLITTPGSGLYVIPASATLILWDALAPGGGGGGGVVTAADSNAIGGGGGGGGGRTTKWVAASDLRAAYPGGVPYTVGNHGVGGAPGVDGTAGGFTFAGNFFVATPGQGGMRGGVLGGIDPTLYGRGGVNGAGDTYGGAGGSGGGFYTYAVITAEAGSDGTWNGTSGGSTLLPNATGGSSVFFVQLGGGGAGGGGGGISPNPQLDNGIWYTSVPPNTPGNGGNSGFASTADPTPITGFGGIVGGAGPTTCGNPDVPGVAVQGGGGGGAASLTGNAQNGALALAQSGSGGGGGGSCRTGHTAGSGNNGGTGYLRITAI